MAERLAPDAAGIARAAELLRAGELVVFPTETVYGLGARADRDAAVAEIYRAKGRPAHNPLIVHVADEAAARRWSSAWNESASRLADAFWPGPLTLVVQAAPELSRLALAGGSTVGLRAPSHPVALALLRAAGLPVAAPSANRSGNVSPTRAEHAEAALGSSVAAILDGGPCGVGIESTVVDLTGAVPRVLRPGAVTRAQIAAVLAQEVASPEDAVRTGVLRSPGLLSRHYAPAIPLRLATAEEAHAARARGAYAVTFGEATDIAADRAVLREDAVAAAASLYALLHLAERSGACEIVFEHPPAGEDWEAIRDRLRRAAAPGDSP
jgi:L-threonylcarbamoyladenylate synthase